MEPKAYRRIAEAPPDVGVTAVAREISAQFGLQGDYSPLVSERDQNFLLRTQDGRRFVIKVTSANEPRLVSRFHVAALRHLQRCDSVATPVVVPTVGGDAVGIIEQGGIQYLLRVASYLDGLLLSNVRINPGLAASLGNRLALLDLALQDFTHDGERPELLWDLQRTGQLRGLVRYIDDPETAGRVEQAVLDFEQKVKPAIGAMRRQVIHGDANPENVLLDPAGSDVRGFIDFGDALNAPLIFEVAIAASYLRASEPLQLLAPFISAYHETLPLEELEIASLFDLLRARLAMTISILYWRLASRPASDPYRQKTLQTETAAIDFLGVLDKFGREAFLDAVNRAIDQE